MVSNRKDKDLRRSRRLEKKSASDYLSNLDEQIFKIEKKIANSELKLERLQRKLDRVLGVIDQTEQRLKREAESKWQRFWRNLPLALAGLVVVAVLAWVLSEVADPANIAGDFYTLIAGGLAVLSLFIALIDGEPYKKNVKDSFWGKVKNSAKDFTSKDTLNIAGITLSLLCAALLLVPLFFSETAEVTPDLCGGIGPAHSYK